jgi:hypothetical protein
MVVQSNINNLNQGEALIIKLSVTEDNGSPVANPEEFTLTLKIAETPYTEAMLTFDEPPVVTLINAQTATWLIKVPNSELSPLVISRKYYYNIVSQEVGQDPVLQVAGQLTINDVID